MQSWHHLSFGQNRVVQQVHHSKGLHCKCYTKHSNEVSGGAGHHTVLLKGVGKDDIFSFAVTTVGSKDASNKPNLSLKVLHVANYTTDAAGPPQTCASASRFHLHVVASSSILVSEPFFWCAMLVLKRVNNRFLLIHRPGRGVQECRRSDRSDSGLLS